MAGKRITSLNTLTGANTATIDVLPIVDVSAGEAKQITTQELSNALVTINGGLQGGFGVYTNTTLGLANTANGGYFFVPSANTGESLSMYQDVGGTAVYITGIPEFNTTENPYGGLSRVDQSGIIAAFVYDTTKDSDGGEWRKKCQHTSWYNESLNTATRGSRREFPKKALIVCTAASVKIYDLDSGVAEMWMVFTGGLGTVGFAAGNTSALTNTGITALNGMIVKSALTYGYAIADFILDTVDVYINSTTHRKKPGGIVNRNSTDYYNQNAGAPLLVDNNANSVAMDVRPGTPPNKNRMGLPTPTIAVGTDGGASIIHWDERVADITWPSGSGIVAKVAFRPTDSALCIVMDSASLGYGRFRHVYHQLPITDVTNTYGYVKGAADEYYAHYAFGAYTGIDFGFYASPATMYSKAFNGLHDAGDLQLTSLLPEPSNPSKGARAVITNSYNSGYMVGDVKLALAESTADVTSLVGSGELVTNGTFASDISGWTDASEAGGSTSWDASGKAALVNGGSTDAEGVLYQTITTVVGKTYVLTANRTTLASIVQIGSTGVGTSNIYQSPNATGAVNTTFVALTTSTTITLRNFNATGTALVDDVSVKLAVPDRSVENHGAIINGTITRAAVATGAELAAYGGFSASNYLEVPYDSDFDFGTGDFCIMGWVNTSSTNFFRPFLMRGYHNGSAYSGSQISVGTNATNALRFTASDDGYATLDEVVGNVLPLNMWSQFCCFRSGNTLYMYQDGVFVDSHGISAASGSLSNNNASIFIGNSAPLTSPLSGSIANLRVSATAPTPEQIRTIYERERVLFQANTKCLAPATNHTTMSYDEDYDILYCTTNGGVYTVKGIQVLDKIIDNNLVYSGITATSNITSKWTSTGANTYIPSIYPFRSEINKTPRKTYDRNKIKTRTYTTDATPKVIYHIPFDEGEEGTFITRTIGVNRDDGTQIGSYEHKYTARRVNGSANVALIGSTNTVIQEVTSSMDVVVSNGSNYITISYTGLASNTIEWTSYTEGTFNDF